MTPAARVAAAIEILDHWRAGTPVEKALTNWARRSRFAGSKDRAAIRDHVFDALRRARSTEALGGASGRGMMIGLLRQQAQDLDAIFNGAGHAPEPLTKGENSPPTMTSNQAERVDCQDWQLVLLSASVGPEKAQDIFSAQRERAPIFLRVNAQKTTLVNAQQSLSGDQIETRPHSDVQNALEVLTNARRIQISKAYSDGLVELQDASSQAAIERLGTVTGLRVLDYCAGGGGKSLALAALGAKVTAHDIDAKRMKDIPARAARAGVRIDVASSPNKVAAYDLVFVDAPCSGSGTYRRTPEAKWSLTPDRLSELCLTQERVLNQSRQFACTNGRIAYATCSVFSEENQKIVQNFLEQNPEWVLLDEMRRFPSNTGDGFYLAIMEKQS